MRIYAPTNLWIDIIPKNKCNQVESLQNMCLISLKKNNKFKILIENHKNNYYDNIKGKPEECIEKINSMLNEGRYDILWNVKKIKTFTKNRNELSSININSKLSKISNNNPNFLQIYNLIN
jgi:hypothetical protein